MGKKFLLNFERASMAHENENNLLFDLVCTGHLRNTWGF